MRRIFQCVALACMYLCATAGCAYAAGQSTAAINNFDSGAPAETGNTPAVPPTERSSVPSSYRPAPPISTIDFGVKLGYYARSTASFRNFLEAGFLAGIPNLPSAPAQPQPAPNLDFTTGRAYENAMDAYGNGMDNWRRNSEVELRYRGRRFAAGLSTAETRDLLSNLILPVALRQDPRYIPAAIDGSFGQRMDHAFTSMIVTRGDNGRLEPNWSKWLGTVGAAYAGKEFYAKEFNVPQLQTNQFVMRYIGYSLAGDLVTNVSREVVRTAIRPDIQMYEAKGPSTEDSYYPLSIGGKFFYWVHSTYAPRNFIQGALIAGIPNVSGQPAYPPTPNITTEQQELAFDAVLEQYGKNVQGWRDNLEDGVRYHERRLIGGFGESETQMFLSNFLVPVALDMDPRYIPLGPGHSAGARMENAFAGVLVGHMDSGRRMVNLPVLVGTVGAAFMAKESYYPPLGVPALERNSVLGKTIGFNLAGDGLLNLLGEFFTHNSY